MAIVLATGNKVGSNFLIAYIINLLLLLGLVLRDKVACFKKKQFKVKSSQSEEYLANNCASRADHTYIMPWVTSSA